eukprot:Ihof_evm5s11 gene=Ihof_evmTU5s11
MFVCYLGGFVCRPAWRDMWPGWAGLRRQMVDLWYPNRNSEMKQPNKHWNRDAQPLLIGEDSMGGSLEQNITGNPIEELRLPVPAIVISACISSSSSREELRGGCEGEEVVQQETCNEGEGIDNDIHNIDNDIHNIDNEEKGGVKGEERTADKNRKLNMAEVMNVAFGFCLLWFVANYLFSVALTLTTVSSVTILSSTSGFFTLLLESAVGGAAKDRLCLINFILVACSVLGVALVSISDAQGVTNNKVDGVGHHSLIGDLVALASAFMYGAYLVFLQKKIGHEDSVDMGMFFGFVGLFNMILLWPIFLALHWSGLETFQIPVAKTWFYLIVNALIGTVLSDYLWLYSTLMTSPLIATLGLSLTIPLAILVDAMIATININALFVCGTILVFIAFL